VGGRSRAGSALHPAVSALIVSFVVVFVAELGDKSQLMALTFASRFRAMPVLIGITVSTAIVHAGSVVIGGGLGASVPTTAITVLAALAFFGFAAWTLRGDSLSADEAGKAGRTTRSAVIAVAVASSSPSSATRRCSPP